MKKILCSVVCLGAFSFANAVVLDSDFMYSKVKDIGEGYKLSDDKVLKWNLRLQKHKDNEFDNPIAASLRVGGRAAKTSVDGPDGYTAGDVDISLADIDIMGGYGFYLPSDFGVTKINILAGFYRAELEIKAKLNSGERNEIKFGSNAIKFGISVFSLTNYNIAFGLDAYVKHYIDDKRKNTPISKKNDEDTKFEADGMIGYKFGDDESGLFLGIKGGYHHDLFSKGRHVGATIGYVF